MKKDISVRKIVLGAGIFVTIFCVPAVSQMIWCNLREVQVEQKAQMPIRVQDLTFVSFGNSSAGEARVLNEAPKSLTRLLVVVDFTAQDGKHLISAPFFNTIDGDLNPTIAFQDWVLAHSEQQVPEIRTKEVQRLLFKSPIVPTSCPISAKITFALLEFADSEVFSWSEDDLQLDPLPIADLDMIEYRCPTRPLRAELEISEQGSIAITVLGSARDDEMRFLDQLAQWKFSRSLRGKERHRYDVLLIPSDSDIESVLNKLDRNYANSDAMLVASTRSGQRLSPGRFGCVVKSSTYNTGIGYATSEE